MFCRNCGAQNDDGVLFCAACGNALNEPAPVQPEVQQPVYQNPNQPVYQNPNQPVYQQPVYPYPGYPYPAYPQPVKKPGQGMAIASLVLGILGLVSMGDGISCILAIVFGCIAKKSGNKSGMATAGLVTGIIGCVLSVIGIILYALAFTVSFGEIM